MRLSPERVEQTLNQIEAHVIPDTHPSMPQIKRLWGDHTYFLDVNGLNIVEPLEREAAAEAGEAGCLVNIASWTDESATQLVPHEPEATEVVVEFAEGKNGDDDEDDDDDDDENGNEVGVKH